MSRNFFLSFFILAVAFSASAQESVFFEGTDSVSSDAMLISLRACTAKTADPNEPRVLEYCLQMAVGRRYLWSKGFLNAQVSPAEKQADGRIKVTIDEGIKYRLGKVNISGSTAFSTDQLLKRLDLASGDIADGRKITDFVFGELKEIYDEAGFIQSTAEFEPKFRNDPESPTEGIADLNIAIDEGRQFSVHQISVIGNLYVKDRIVQNAILTQPGDIFNRRKFDQSVKRLNQLGLFEVIRDDDLEINIDSETGDVNIVVKVIEKRRKN